MNKEKHIHAKLADQRQDFAHKLTDFCSLLNSRKDEAQAEIDKLKPIIDMANLALRGLSNE